MTQALDALLPRPPGWPGWPRAALLVGVVLGLGWGYRVQGQAQERRQFQMEARAAREEIARGFQGFARALETLEHRLPADREIDRAIWDAALAEPPPLIHPPGLAKFQYVQRVPSADRARVEADLAREGTAHPRFWGLDGAPRPEGSSDFFPIRHLEPWNPQAAGFDVACRPGFLEEVVQPALQARGVVLARRIRPVEDPAHPLVGVSLAHPRPDSGRPLAGFVCCLVRVPDLLAELRRNRHPALEVEVYEGDRPDPDQLLFTERPARVAGLADPGFRHQDAATVRILGLDWHVVVTAGSGWTLPRAPAAALPWFALGGLLIWVTLKLGRPPA